MRKVYTIEPNCINCHWCELYCRLAHSDYPDLIALHNNNAAAVVAPARIRVQERSPHSFAIQCRHCEEPECVRACISGAMTKDPLSGIVSCEENKCVGCLSCVLACPNSAVHPAIVAGRKKVIKCDLCRHQETPACVEHCPNRALVFTERKEA